MGVFAIARLLMNLMFVVTSYNVYIILEPLKYDTVLPLY